MKVRVSGFISFVKQKTKAKYLELYIFPFWKFLSFTDDFISTSFNVVSPMSVSSQGQLVRSKVASQTLLWVSKQHALHVVRVTVCCSSECLSWCKKLSF